MFLGRVVLPDEPVWLDADREKVRALVSVWRTECRQCGTRRDDWVDERGFPLDEPAWMLEPVHCIGCDEYEKAHKQINKQKRRGMSLRFVGYLPEEEDGE